MSAYQDLINKEKSFLSQKIPKKEPILQEVACMSPKYRKIYGHICAFAEITGNKRLDRFKRAVQILGMTQAVFSELSQLGFKLGVDARFETINLEELGIIKS